MIQVLANEFAQNRKYVTNLIDMYTEGSTVPFISRYRKEQTGGMDSELIREIVERYDYLISLAKRKEEVIKLIDEQGKLTDEVKKQVMDAKTLKEVEDIYAPFKSKRKTKADIAKEAGLEPLAIFIKETEDISGLDEKAAGFVNENVPDAETAIKMACDILIHDISHDMDIRSRIQELFEEQGMLTCEKRKEVDAKERTRYEDYYEFEEKISTLKPHRVLAIFRGEKEKILKVKLVCDEEVCLNACVGISADKGFVLNEVVLKCVRQAYKKSIELAVELDKRGELKEAAQAQAIEVFADNIKNLLLTPTVKNKTIMGIDPAFRTGCKYAVVDSTGKLLGYDVMYPTQPQNDYHKSRDMMVAAVKEFDVDAVVIGNGTGSRETEEFVAKVIEEEGLDIKYAIISEAGASVYSASELGKREFPELDETIRGAISIARRVIDPLAELVKIDPKSIGVGMYQHDVNQKKLGSTLAGVVEDVVNSVGVDVNTSSPALMQYVAGLSYQLAEKIVSYREANGKIKSRKELLGIDGIGEKIFEQCAGFLKVYDGEEPLDSLFIHPESYENTYKLLSKLGADLNTAKGLVKIVQGQTLKKLTESMDIGEFTLQDIVESLSMPDRDVRDSVDPIEFKEGVLSLDDLDEGMILDGKVTNVVDFGAFVDIGLKNDGLVHISELADKFVSKPSDVVSVGKKVKVRVLSVDRGRGRVSLSMKMK